MFDPKKMINALTRGDKPSVEELVKTELKKGTAAMEILNKGLVAGMDIVGEKMESADMFIPDVLMAAKAMSGMERGSIFSPWACHSAATSPSR